MKIRYLISSLFLLALTGCQTPSAYTTQDFVRNQANYDHNCDSKNLTVGPTAGVPYTEYGQAFSVVCKDSNNSWKSLYTCEKQGVFAPSVSCKEIEHKKAAEAK